MIPSYIHKNKASGAEKFIFDAAKTVLTAKNIFGKAFGDISDCFVSDIPEELKILVVGDPADFSELLFASLANAFIGGSVARADISQTYGAVACTVTANGAKCPKAASKYEFKHTPPVNFKTVCEKHLWAAEITADSASICFGAPADSPQAFGNFPFADISDIALYNIMLKYIHPKKK